MEKYAKNSCLKHLILLLILLISFIYFLFYIILNSGNDKVKIQLRNNDDSVEDIYLKSNGDIVSISYSPKMKFIQGQKNIAVSDFFILYKNTYDTLYIVCFSIDLMENVSNIRFIYEEKGISPKLIDDYCLKGYKIFPKNAYI